MLAFLGTLPVLFVALFGVELKDAEENTVIAILAIGFFICAALMGIAMEIRRLSERM